MEAERLMTMCLESMDQLKLCGLELQQHRIPNDIFRTYVCFSNCCCSVQHWYTHRQVTAAM